VNKVEQAEQILAESVGRCFAALTGSGTTALMMACRLLPDDRRRVIVPANACSHVMYAVLYADKTPVFADVRLQDATLDPGHVAVLLAADPEIGAVIAVHLYGHRADMDALCSLTKQRGVLLIEDAAQAQGGRHPDGRPFGAFGDLSIISFGHTKILDAGGGGVLLFDNPVFGGRVRSDAAKLPPALDNVKTMAEHYSHLFFTSWEAYRADHRLAVLFDSLPDLFRTLFVSSTNEQQAQKILTALPGLTDELTHRRDLYTAYCEALRSLPSVILFDVDINTIAPWRFSFRVPREVREELLCALRGADYHVSSWYPCLADWTPAGRNPENLDVPVARTLEAEIVNLWLTRDHSRATVTSLAALIDQTLSNRDELFHAEK
jgi:dTDP-4-amino-4,6-dideoxygalactose transaminase